MSEEERQSYIVPGAKEEQKRRMDDQVGKVREKLTKWADKIIVGGFNPTPVIERKEGDVWTESDGRTWTVKNGIKQTTSVFDGTRMPWWCPRCNRPLNHKLHEKFYRIRGACHDCVVKYEGKMRVEGVWDAYERRTMRNNERAWLYDKLQEYDQLLRTFRAPQLHFSDGRWEKLTEEHIYEEALERVRKDGKLLVDRLNQMNIDEDADVAEQQKLTEWENANPWTV